MYRKWRAVPRNGFKTRRQGQDHACIQGPPGLWDGVVAGVEEAAMGGIEVPPALAPGAGLQLLLRHAGRCVIVAGAGAACASLQTT